MKGIFIAQAWGAQGFSREDCSASESARELKHAAWGYAVYVVFLASRRLLDSSCGRAIA